MLAVKTTTVVADIILCTNNVRRLGIHPHESREITMRSVVTVLLGLMLFASAADAQPGRGPGRGGPGEAQIPSIQNAVGIAVSVAFDVAVKQTIQNYFRTNPMVSQGLPPGIARNLARGKPLPPGIAKRFLPSDLQARLPAYSGYEMLIAGRNVLLVSIASGIITDILLDVL